MIYLKLKKKPKTISELLHELFSYHPEDSDTFSSVKTYTDPECKTLECGQGRYRSLDAIVEIARTYFPEATEKEIFLALINLKYNAYDEYYDETTEYKIQFISCHDIYKPTVYFTDAPCYSVYDSNIKLKNSNYSWLDFMKILDFTTKEELAEYMESL